MKGHPTTRSAAPESVLALEVSHFADGRYRLVVSIPGRQGTVEHLWRAPVPWDDLQCRVLAILGEYLLLTGGVQLALPCEL